MSKELDFDKLRFIRIFTPMHIPKYLIEQVRDKCFEVDDWYKYQETICLRQTPNGPQLNPLSMLYVIADEDNKVIGMLWCEVEPLSKVLLVQTFSMDKKYWYRGKAVTLLAKKAKEILKECKLKKIMWMTNYPAHSERYGFKRSRSVCMEYMEKEDGTSIEGGDLDRSGTINDTGTEPGSGSDARRDGASSTRRVEPVPATV